MKNKKLLRKILFCIGAVFVIAALIVYALKPTFTNDEKLNKILLEVIIKSAVFLYTIIAFYCLDKKIFQGKQFDSLWLIPCFLTAVVNFPFGALITKAAHITRLDLLWIYAINCLLTALTEELIFRGVLLDELLNRKTKSKRPILKAIVFSALIFGVWHLANIASGADVFSTLLQVGYTFLLGLAFGVMYLKTKSIIYSAIVHFIFNVGGNIVPVLGSGTFHDISFWILTVSAGILLAVHCFLTYIKIEPLNE